MGKVAVAPPPSAVTCNARVSPESTAGLVNDGVSVSIGSSGTEVPRSATMRCTRRRLPSRSRTGLTGDGHVDYQPAAFAGHYDDLEAVVECFYVGFLWNDTQYSGESGGKNENIHYSLRFEWVL